MSEEINLSDNTSQISKSVSFVKIAKVVSKSIFFSFFFWTPFSWNKKKYLRFYLLIMIMKWFRIGLLNLVVSCVVQHYDKHPFPTLFRHLFCWKNTRLFTVLSFPLCISIEVELYYSKHFLWRESKWSIANPLCKWRSGYFVRILHFCRQFWNVLVVILYYSG